MIAVYSLLKSIKRREHLAIVIEQCLSVLFLLAIQGKIK